MEVRHLRYFVAVGEEGNLTSTAKRRLHTSEASLSRQILPTGALGPDRAVVAQRSWRRANRCAQGFYRSLALMQVDAAVEAARRAAQLARKTFAIGFQTEHEMKHQMVWSSSNALRTQPFSPV
jgi:LysR family hca operon transcriptional activator